MLKFRVLLFFAAGFVFGAAATTAAILLRVRNAPEPMAPPPRPPMPSWSEEAQKIHRCSRPACGKRIVKSREGDRQIVRRTVAGIEYFHAACWDEGAGEPRP